MERLESQRGLVSPQWVEANASLPVLQRAVEAYKLTNERFPASSTAQSAMLILFHRAWGEDPLDALSGMRRSEEAIEDIRQAGMQRHMKRGRGGFLDSNAVIGAVESNIQRVRKMVELDDTSLSNICQEVFPRYKEMDFFMHGEREMAFWGEVESMIDQARTERETNQK